MAMLIMNLRKNIGEKREMSYIFQDWAEGNIFQAVATEDATCRAVKTHGTFE